MLQHIALEETFTEHCNVLGTAEDKSLWPRLGLINPGVLCKLVGNQNHFHLMAV